MRAKGNSGEHLCSNPPYGYQKDPVDKKKWIVDEEAARIVERIFALCIAGKGPMQIAKLLTAKHVLTVKAHLCPAGRKSAAGETLQVEPQVYCGDIGATRVHRLHGELQDLFQVPQAEKTAA